VSDASRLCFDCLSFLLRFVQCLLLANWPRRGLSCSASMSKAFLRRLHDGVGSFGSNSVVDSSALNPLTYIWTRRTEQTRTCLSPGSLLNSSEWISSPLRTFVTGAMTSSCRPSTWPRCLDCKTSLSIRIWCNGWLERLRTYARSRTGKSTRLRPEKPQCEFRLS
jgi:hypothetical protein